MNDRQILQFTEMVRAIRGCYQDVLEAGASPEYAQALAGYAASNLVRRLRRATRGVTCKHMIDQWDCSEPEPDYGSVQDESMVASI